MCRQFPRIHGSYPEPYAWSEWHWHPLGYRTRSRPIISTMCRPGRRVCPRSTALGVQREDSNDTTAARGCSCAGGRLCSRCRSRSRDGHHWPPPPQIRTCGITASGSARPSTYRTCIYCTAPVSPAHGKFIFFRRAWKRGPERRGSRNNDRRAEPPSRRSFRGLTMAAPVSPPCWSRRTSHTVCRRPDRSSDLPESAAARRSGTARRRSRHRAHKSRHPRHPGRPDSPQ